MDMNLRVCAKCGDAFSRDRKLSAKQWERRLFCSRVCAGKRRAVGDDTIIELYVGGLTCEEIGKQVGVTGTQVQRILRPFGVIRGASERQRRSHSRPEVKRKLSKAAKGRPCQEHVKAALRERTGSKNQNWRSGLTVSAGGYLQFTNSSANGEHAGKYLHTIIAEWTIGRSLADGEIVHHGDGNKLNNQPANLQVMTQSEHARLHFTKNGEAA